MSLFLKSTHHNQLFLEYTIKCYESFMAGADDFEEMNAELQSKLSKCPPCCAAT